MAAPDFDNPDLSKATSVVTAHGWHPIVPGTLEISDDGDLVRFLITPPGSANEWLVSPAHQVVAVVYPAEPGDV